MRTKILAVLGTMLTGAAYAQTPTPVYGWDNSDGSVGYVSGRQTVVKSIVYGVLGSPYAAAGSVYSLTPPGSGTGYTEKVIKTFTGGAKGGYPTGGLLADTKGHLYGATFGGGITKGSACTNPGYGGCGTIYKLTNAAGKTTWTMATIYKFKGGTDGLGPVGNLVFDSKGALYGVTQWGGCTPTQNYGYGCGTVFKLTPPPAGSTKWTYQRLYTFLGGANDGAYPVGPLAVDAAGNVFGTTQFGGASASGCNTTPSSPDGLCGTVFELAYNAGTGKYTESILHAFTDGTDGSVPAGGVVLDSSGNIYGTATQGGTNTGLCLNFGYSGCGQVWELVKPASGSIWAKQTLLNFSGTTNPTDGARPSALLIDSKGQLFGTASFNTGAGNCPLAYYCGTLFKLSSNAGVWNETVMYTFNGAPSGSFADPEFGLAADSSGTLYGVTEYNVTSTAFTLTGSGYTP